MTKEINNHYVVVKNERFINENPNIPGINRGL